MNDATTSHGRRVRWATGAALVAAGAISGGVLAWSFNASATSGTGSSSTSGESSEQDHGPFPDHGSRAHESAEKAVTGADATKAQAAAVKAVGGGKAGAVTTDFTGDGYEVTVTTTDGSSVEVHLDSSFVVNDHGFDHGGH